MNDYRKEEFKKYKKFDRLFWNTLKEMTIFSVFFFFLLVVAYSNNTNAGFTANQLFKSTFVDSQSLNEMNLNDVSKIFNVDNNVSIPLNTKSLLNEILISF